MIKDVRFRAAAAVCKYIYEYRYTKDALRSWFGTRFVAKSLFFSSSFIFGSKKAKIKQDFQVCIIKHTKCKSTINLVLCIFVSLCVHFYSLLSFMLLLHSFYVEVILVLLLKISAYSYAPFFRNNSKSK